MCKVPQPQAARALLQCRLLDSAFSTPMPAYPPPLFVSHGSPMLALEPGRTGPMLRRLGDTFRRDFARPRAVVALSAHSLTRQPTLLGALTHPAIHDFGGFPEALYALQYTAPGVPDLAGQLHTLSQGQLALSDQGGLDHGLWVPLRYLWPDGDMPILPLTFSPQASPAELFALGGTLQALLPPDVAILTSGSITHNLRQVFAVMQRMQPGGPEAEEVPASAAFRRWMWDRSQARDWPALLDYRRQAPHAHDMHPTDEHLLPWFIAAGAGGTGIAPARLHDDVEHGSLGMDAYAFGPEAHTLNQTLQAH